MNYEDTLTYLRRIAKPASSRFDLPDEEEEAGLEAGGQHTGSDQSSAAPSIATQSREGNGKTPILDDFSTDLTQAAKEGKLDPVVGRDKEILRVIEILGRRRKSSPILIDEPGVGKSAIIRGLAQLTAKHKTSPMLFNKRVVSLDTTVAVTGTKYREQFEERTRALLKELEQNPDTIVFTDEIRTLISAESTSRSMDATNIMRPALARGVIQCIGATTLGEYRNSIEKDDVLERRFQKMLIGPTTTDEMLQVLKSIKEKCERHHHVQYSDETLLACVKLTERYVTSRLFLDKAIDAMDGVGSKVLLQYAKVPSSITDKEKRIDAVKIEKQEAIRDQSSELTASYRDKQIELEIELEGMNKQWSSGKMDERVNITADGVADAVSVVTGVPIRCMAEAEGVRLKGMAKELKDAVTTQDLAIDKLVRVMQRNRVGLKDPNHPIGAFVFLGPTGVGKTYLAKKLAGHVFGSTDALIKIDMSEYTEGFDVSWLVGAPPGYIGYEKGGQLTERVKRHPYSVVLPDEIGKAHGNVFNTLLQVLDEGRLTDGNGRLVDFKNTVVITTSNAGTRQLKEFGRGVGPNTANNLGPSVNDKNKEYACSIIQKNLSKQFAPEFLNRLDETIISDQLDLNAIKKIINIELTGLFKRIEGIGCHIHVSDEAKEFVATKGYGVQLGVRPLERTIQTYIEDGVAIRILSGGLHLGDTITIEKKPGKDELVFK